MAHDGERSEQFWSTGDNVSGSNVHKINDSNVPIAKCEKDSWMVNVFPETWYAGTSGGFNVKDATRIFSLVTH